MRATSRSSPRSYGRSGKREGLPPLPDTDVEAIVEQARRGIRTVEQPDVLHTIRADLQAYQRGVLKIAYELAFHWLGDDYLDDPLAEKLRQAILIGGEHEIRGVVELGSVVPPFDTIWTDEANSHIGMCMRSGPAIAIGVRVFNVMSGVVSVTENPAIYPAISDGAFFACDPQSGSTRETPLPEELFRIIRSGRRAPSAISP